jgi:hypothetical protein
MAQGIEIVGILVAAGNRQHPSAQDNLLYTSVAFSRLH